MSTPTETEQITEQLKSLLRESRNAHGKKDLDGARERARAGLDLAQRAGLPGETAVFQAQILIIDKKCDDAVTLLTPLIEQEFSMRGHARDRLASALHEKREYDRAIEYYRTALDTPGFDTPGMAWFRIGYAYEGKGDYDQAIECYRAALGTPGYDTPAHAWNNMGIAHAKKKEYDRAIECLRTALDTPGYDTPGTAWNNVGNVHEMREEYDRAIECYRKALNTPGYDAPSDAWYNMGLAWRGKQDFENALECFEKAAKAYAQTGADSDVTVAKRALTKQLISARKEGSPSRAEEAAGLADLLTETRSGRDSDAEPDESDPIAIIIEQMAKFESATRQYAGRTGSGLKHVLAVLKGWASFTPALAEAERAVFQKEMCRGGGYFIKGRATGVILDPGYDFTRNFSDEGFHIREVGDVVVTHNHVDHRDDLTRIADLAAKLGANRKVKNISFWLDKDTYKASDPVLRSLGVEGPNCNPVAPCRKQRMSSGIRLDSFKAIHGTPRFEEPLGGAFTVPIEGNRKCVIGYTSDTAYFDELPNHLKDAHILICHFSSARAEDLKGEKRHDNHLGFTGLMDLIANTNASLYIISEFWGGKGDIRFELIQTIKYRFRQKGRNVPVLAGDIGLMVDLNRLYIRCTQCGKFVDYDDIRTVKPATQFGRLRYLCKQCLT